MATSTLKWHKQPKILWEGTWNLQGSITVNNLNDYSLFIISGDNWPLIAAKNGAGTIIVGSVIGPQGSNQYVRALRLEISGNTLTCSQNNNVSHIAGGQHGTQSTVGSVTSIYGIA